MFVRKKKTGRMAFLSCDRAVRISPVKALVPSYQIGHMIYGCALGIILSGCGAKDSGPPRFPISGAVTYQGAPVPHGEILFLPDASQGNEGPAGYATIVNGRYSTAQQGRGIIGGMHQVVINGTETLTKTDGDAEPLPLLFPEYRTTLNLSRKAATADFNIP